MYDAMIIQKIHFYGTRKSWMIEGSFLSIVKKA